MAYEYYKILHLLGLSMVMLSLGGVVMHVINGGSKADNRFRVGAIVTHGIGLVLLLVAGFGMLHKLGVPHDAPWVLGKLAIWVVMGGVVAVAYRKPQLARALWVAIPALVVVAAALVIFKG
jgi:hypothetical protein